ncbi:MAG TPA: efflux RND transporter periplasmic adaptor subunit [Chitinophagaceae bacterium]|nr:efflux RND transporter periplasmic adaptor subunit [Chitinophagaceae bacterium]
MRYNSYMITIAVSILLLASCSSKQETTTAQDNNTPIAVTTALPSTSNQSAVQLSGKLGATNTTMVSTRLMGTITKVNVNVGDKVQAGQTLAVVNSSDVAAKGAQVDAMIAEAEAHLTNAQKDYDRYTQLYQQQSASAKELDNITLQYQAAKARVAAAKQMRNEVNVNAQYAVIKAPFAGIVSQKNATIGGMATPGMPLFTIEQGGALVAYVGIPESDVQHIQVGNIATINVSATNSTYQGKVLELNASSQFTGGQYMAKISITSPNANLYAGMYVQVTIPYGKKENSNHNSTIMIPAAAIYRKDQLQGVFTIGANNRAVLRWLRLGKTEGNMVEVLSGLTANEVFVLNADGKLYNGARVTVR